MKDSDSSIETVTAALQGILSGDLDAAMARFDSDPKWNVGEALAEGGRHDGHDAIRAMLSARRERFSGGYTLGHLTVHGGKDHVVAEYTRRGKSEGGAEEHCLSVFELVVGKIREVREFTFRIG